MSATILTMSIIISQDPVTWTSKKLALLEKGDKQVVLIDGEDFDPDLEGCFGSEYDKVLETLLSRNTIKPPVATVNEDGNTKILQGEQLYQVLRDLGNRIIPVLMTKRSIANARHYKYVRKYDGARYEQKLGGIVLFRNTFDGTKILLLKDNKGKWDIPKGHVHNDETFLQGAIRECYEETGIRARVDTRTFLDLPTNSKLFRIYQGSTDEGTVALSNEHAKYRWVSPTSAIRKLDFPQLQHAIATFSTVKGLVRVNPPDKYLTLAEVYGDALPHQDEMIWNFVDQDGWESDAYKVISINPTELANLKNSSGQTILEIYEDFAEDWQRELVEDMRPQTKELAKTILVISDDTVVDGYHRLVAMALEGVTSALAVDIY